MKIDSLEALKSYREKINANRQYRLKLYVCAGTSCVSSKSIEIADALNTEVERKGLSVDVKVVKTGCFGFCGQGPIIEIEPDKVTYVKVKPSDVKEIVGSHLVNRQIVERLTYDKSDEGDYEMAFYKKQKRIALRHCGFIDPESLEDAVAHGGYEALAKSLFELSPDDVIEILKDSGLRGRGGGGFPTGLKWQFTKAVEDPEKYVICNADEGDPGAFMDRSICEGDPHAILEAMAINGYATGAKNGLIYIRAEYGLATKRLKKALKDARKAGFLGENIFGTDFSFDIELKAGAGAFVCGEETALIHSMEGLRGEPSVKPPFPSEKGFRGKPSNVNNVETYVNIPIILTKGAKWFSSIGTEHSKGTKVFALAGNVRNIGLVEVPMGTTFREIIYDIGGGIPDDLPFKGVQIGGPSGGVITEEYLDTPIDYDSLKEVGAMMGSGGMIVMDDKTDMVEIAKFYLDFTQDESCGKCTPCRIGTKRMHEMLEKLTNMEGNPEDLEILEELAGNIQNTSLCGLGQSAPNPVLSTLRFFREEYEAYANRETPHGYRVIEEDCIGCTKCKRVCPVDAISGELKKPHTIDQATCILCGACAEACPKGAIVYE
ncbi:MAG: NADH-ubiquinone oxidoreductase-F iron-sulfur binding region domain-containing protein [Bacillota bacterium]